jgi:hypothetical protein
MTDIVVSPDHFIDGASGRFQVDGFNGIPRILCEAGGLFQVGAGTDSTGNVNTFSASGGANPRPVGANGYHMAKAPQAWGSTTPVGPEIVLPPGSTWPPSWWPPQPPAGDAFQPGVVSVWPEWSTDTDYNPYAWGAPPDDDDDDDDNGTTLSAQITQGEQPMPATATSAPKGSRLFRPRSRSKK